MNRRRTVGCCGVRGLALAVSLSLGPRFVHAADDDATPTTEATVRMSFSDAVEQLEHGEARRAIATLDRARRSAQQLGDSELRSLILHRLDFEVARAYLEVASPTREELAHAQACLDRFLGEENDPERRALAHRWLDEVRRRHDSLAAEVVDAPVEGRPRLEPIAGPSDEPLAARHEAPRPAPRIPLPASTIGTMGDASPMPRRHAAHTAARLKIGGGVILGGAAASLVVMIVGTVLAQRAEHDYRAGPSREQRDDALQRGRMANGWIAGSAVMSGLLVAAGSTMLTLGALRHRRGFSGRKPAL